jgi:hypothetical protein
MQSILQASLEGAESSSCISHLQLKRRHVPQQQIAGEATAQSRAWREVEWQEARAKGRDRSARQQRL